jgi:hypothetical protein
MTTDNTAPRSGSAKAVEAKPEHHSTGELRAEAARARAELAGTLDAIEYKLNVPKQIKINTRRFTLGLHRLGDENPTALAGIALGAAAVVGTTVWWGVKTVLDRR